MDGFEVKGEDGRFTLPSAGDLVAAVRTGKLGRATMVRQAGSSEWVTADSVPEVAALFAGDVWAAWDDEADEGVLDAFQIPEPVAPRAPLEPAPTIPPAEVVTELPAAALTPVDVPPPAARNPPSLADQPITPASTTHPLAAPTRRPTAKVIDFPQPRKLNNFGSVALKPQPRPSESMRPPAVRWGGIALLAAVGCAVLMMWVWFVNINATADFAPRTATAQVVESIPPLDGEAAAAAVNPYETLEDELRDQLMEGLLDIPGEGEFEDALLIELRRVRVDVRSVRVKILTWAGRRQDLPDQVSFNLKVMARDGELDRDLGALGLVMGKYIQHYGLQAVELNVILSSEDGLRKVVMDPEVARRYFTHRVSLERFLQSAFSGA
ncbi:MAG: hypothetical protein VX127_03855 [Myxococcota bacterium]|nr:hypothetical protein [Myxococcota bacterium]